MQESHNSRGRLIYKSLESRLLKKRSFAVHIADYLTTSFGSVSFFLLNGIVFIAWIFVNLGKIPGISPFDPFPFNLLTMTVSLEAIFLSIIVLMSQNRQSLVSSLREEIDMQVNLIAEKEITKILKLNKLLLEERGIKLTDAELIEMLKDIDTSFIERELEKQLSDKPESIVTKVENEVKKGLKFKI